MGRNEHGSIVITATCSRVKSRICIWTEVKVCLASPFREYRLTKTQDAKESSPVNKHGEMWFHIWLFIAVVFVTIVCNVLNSFLEDGLGLGLYRFMGRLIRHWLYDPRPAHEIPVY